MNLLHQFQASPMIQRLGWTLLHSLWQGAVIAMLLAVLLPLTRSARIRYAFACAALLLLSVWAAITFALSERGMMTKIGGLAQFAYSAPAIPPAGSPLQPSSQGMEALRLIPLLVALWMTGVIGQALRQCVGWLRVQRLRRGRPIDDPAWLYVLRTLAARLRIRRLVLLVRSAHVDVPAVVGVLCPVILVPLAMFNELSPEQARAILAHELAHIRRCDYAVNLIQMAIETIFFHHPAVWWISAQIRKERENCCDDLAASVCGRTIYAGALVSLEERRATPFALAATDGSLLRRIGRLVGAPPPRRQQARSVLVAIIALVCVLVPVGLQRIGRARADNVPTTAPSNAKSQYTYFHVTIGDDGFIAVNGGVGNWQTLRDELAKLPVQERAKIVISISAETEDLPVGKYFEAEAQGVQLVKDLGLAYLSNTGVERRVNPKKGNRAYIGGDVPRTGVYDISSDGMHRITIRQLIIAAGGITPKGAPAWITLIRRSDGAETFPLMDSPVDAAMSVPSLDVYLQPDDSLNIRTSPRLPRNSAPATRPSSPPSASIQGYAQQLREFRAQVDANRVRMNTADLELRAIDRAWAARASSTQPAAAP